VHSFLGRETALHVAVAADYLVAVNALLRLGASIDAENKYRSTPLHCVRSVNVARALVERGANIFALDGEPGTLQVSESTVLFGVSMMK
jgi:hypothetical protein